MNKSKKKKVHKLREEGGGEEEVEGKEWGGLDQDTP